MSDRDSLNGDERGAVGTQPFLPASLQAIEYEPISNGTAGIVPAGEAEKTSIFVAVRVRPFSERELTENESSCIRFDANNQHAIIVDSHSSSVDSKIFCYDYIALPTSTQSDLFTRVALPAADSCLEGYNGCIFAYGQTGAGKTFTITGSSSMEQVINTENRGMLPRVLDYIFQKIRAQQLHQEQQQLLQQQQQQQFQESSFMEDQSQSITAVAAAVSAAEKIEFLVKCSYLEIYNEHIIDLLADNGSNLQLREDVKKGVFVDNLTEIETQNFLQAAEILKTGGRNRHNGATSMNRESSRSHTVFSITLQSKTASEGVTHIKYSRFHFVDLAGSERIKQTNAVGERLKEGCNINKSLSILGNVINALVDVDNGRARHIHYRDSKLTFLLKDSLGGNSKTRLIANISPASSAFQETLSTLKFAKRAKLIKNKVQINEDHSGNIDALNNEIKKLRQENLQFREIIIKAQPISSLNLPQEVANTLNAVKLQQLQQQQQFQQLQQQQLQQFSEQLSNHEASQQQQSNPFQQQQQQQQFQNNISLTQLQQQQQQMNRVSSVRNENNRLQESEELCQHYLEQANEVEQKMHANLGRTKDQLKHLNKYVQKFQSNEVQYRSIIMLQRARIQRLEAFLERKHCEKETVDTFFAEEREAAKQEVSELKELLNNQMYCTKLLAENAELKAKVERVSEPTRSINELLMNNFDVLKGIQHKLERNVEQRVKLHQILEEFDENSAMSTTTASSVEMQDRPKRTFAQIAATLDHDQRAGDSNESELLAEIQEYKARLRESESSMEKLQLANEELQHEVDSMKSIIEVKQQQHDETILELKRVISETPITSATSAIASLSFPVSNASEGTSSHSNLSQSHMQNVNSVEKSVDIQLLRNFELSEMIARLNEQNLVLQEEVKEVERLRSEKRAAIERASKQQEDLNQLQHALEQLESQHSERDIKMSDLIEEANLTKLTAEKRRLAAEKKLAELEEKFTDLDYRYQTQRVQLEEEVETLNETLAFRQSELDEIRGRHRSALKSHSIDLHSYCVDESPNLADVIANYATTPVQKQSGVPITDGYQPSHFFVRSQSESQQNQQLQLQSRQSTTIFDQKKLLHPTQNQNTNSESNLFSPHKFSQDNELLQFQEQQQSLHQKSQQYSKTTNQLENMREERKSTFSSPEQQNEKQQEQKRQSNKELKQDEQNQQQLQFNLNNQNQRNNLQNNLKEHRQQQINEIPENEEKGEQYTQLQQVVENKTKTQEKQQQQQQSNPIDFLDNQHSFHRQLLQEQQQLKQNQSGEDLDFVTELEQALKSHPLSRQHSLTESQMQNQITLQQNHSQQINDLIAQLKAAQLHINKQSLELQSIQSRFSQTITEHEIALAQKDQELLSSQEQLHLQIDSLTSQIQQSIPASELTHRIEQSLNEKQKEIDRFTSEQYNQTHNLKQTIESREQELAQLRNSLDELITMHDYQQKESLAFQSTTTTQLNQNAQTIEQLSNELAINKQTNKNLSEQLDQSVNELKETITQLQEKESLIRSLNALSHQNQQEFESKLAAVSQQLLSANSIKQEMITYARTTESLTEQKQKELQEAFEKEIAGYKRTQNEKITELTAANEIEVHRLKEQFKSDLIRMAELEKQKHIDKHANLELQIEHLSLIIEEHQSVIADREQKLAAALANAELEKSITNDLHKTRIAELTQSIESLKQTNLLTSRALQNEKQENQQYIQSIETIKVSHESKITELLKTHSKEIKQLGIKQQQLQSELDRYQKEKENEINAIQVEQSREMEQLQSSHNERLQVLQSEFNSKLDEYNQKLEELANECTNKTTTLNSLTMHLNSTNSDNAHLHSLIESLESQLETERMKFVAKCTNMQSHIDKQLLIGEAEQEQKWRNEINQHNEQHQASQISMHQLQSDLNQAMQHLHEYAALENNWSNTADRLAAEKTQLEEKLAEQEVKINKLKKKVKSASSKTDKDLVEKENAIILLKEQLSQFSELNSALKDQIVSLKPSKDVQNKKGITEQSNEQQKSQKVDSQSNQIDEIKRIHAIQIEEIEKKLQNEQNSNSNAEKLKEQEQIVFNQTNEIEHLKKLTKHLQSQKEHLERDNREKDDLNSQLIAKLSVFKDQLLLLRREDSVSATELYNYNLNTNNFNHNNILHNPNSHTQSLSSSSSSASISAAVVASFHQSRNSQQQQQQISQHSHRSQEQQQQFTKSIQDLKPPLAKQPVIDSLTKQNSSGNLNSFQYSNGFNKNDTRSLHIDSSRLNSPKNMIPLISKTVTGTPSAYTNQKIFAKTSSPQLPIANHSGIFAQSSTPNYDRNSNSNHQNSNDNKFLKPFSHR